MSALTKYNDFISQLFGGESEYKFTDKGKAIKQHMTERLTESVNMFEWENLPINIKPNLLEIMLQMTGNACFYEYNGELYIFSGGLGGEPDVNYLPTIYTIANPALDISKSLRIDEECVVMWNNPTMTSLYNMYNRYATMMCENEITMLLTEYNNRIMSLISASDDRTRQSAEDFIAKMIKGEIGVIGESALIDSLKTSKYHDTQGNLVTQLIEMQQYIKASWYNDIGLNANYNMKREQLTDIEGNMNTDALLPLVDGMLKMREEGIKKVNDMYGTNITVKKSSSWEDNEIEINQNQGKEGDVNDNPENNPE